MCLFLYRFYFSCKLTKLVLQNLGLLAVSVTFGSKGGIAFTQKVELIDPLE
jgi:hypothetical protein